MTPPAVAPRAAGTTAPARRPPSPDLAVGISQASIGFMLASLGSCLVLLARDLSVARSELSWLSAGFGAGLLLLGLVGARLLAFGALRVLGGSSAGLAAGALLVGTSSRLFAAQAGALLLGLGGAGIVLVSPALLSGPALAARLTRVSAASSVAGIGAPLLIGAVDALSGRGRLAMLLPVPCLLWIAARALRVPVTAAPGSVPEPTPSDGDRRVVSALDLELVVSPHAGAAGRAAPRWLRAWASMVAAVSPEFAFVVWGAARLQDSGLSPAAAAAAAVAFPVGMGVGRMVAPSIMGRVPLVGWGVALASASACLAAAPVGPALATAALAGAGLGIAPLYPVLLARLLDTPGLSLERGAAIGATASGAAVLAAPILLNAIASGVSLTASFLAVVPSLLAVIALQRRPGAARRNP